MKTISKIVCVLTIYFDVIHFIIIKRFSLIKYYMNAWKNQKTDNLIKALLALQKPAEARKFLRDLMTEKEIAELGNRWKAAQMLDQNVSYAQIVQNTGLSSTTIARISKWMKEGMGGYRLMLDRMSKKHHTTLSRSRND